VGPYTPVVQRHSAHSALKKGKEKEMKWDLQWHIQIHVVALYLSFFTKLEFKNEFCILQFPWS